MLVALVSNLTFGAVAIEIQTGGTLLPTYWSGTSCRLDVFAYSLPIQEPGEGPGWTEPTIDEAWMWLRGYENPNDPQEETTTQEIFHWKRRMAPWPGPFNFSVGQRIMFDSSHFEHGSRVEIHVKIIEDGGAVTEARESTTVYNVAGLFSQQDAHHSRWPGSGGITAAEVIKPLLELNNYAVPFYEIGVPGQPTTNWSNAEFLNAYTQCTLIYVDTHGSCGGSITRFIDSTSHITSQCGPVYALPHPTGFDVLPRTQSKVGTGMPPFQSGLPTTWLSYIDACESSQTNSFAESMLWPYHNYYGGWTENQANIGWDANSAWYNKSYHAIEMYQYMLEGYDNVHTASVVGGFPRYSGVASMVVHGDHHARIKGAYYPYIAPNGRPEKPDFDNNGIHDWWYPN